MVSQYKSKYIFHKFRFWFTLSAVQWSIEMTQNVSLLGYIAGQYIFAEAITVDAKKVGPTRLPSDNTIQAQIIP